MTGTVRAIDSFSYDDKHGTSVVVRKGELRPANHPDVKGREHLFESADEFAGRQGDTNRPLETATAAPGERRVLSGGKS